MIGFTTLVRWVTAVIALGGGYLRIEVTCFWYSVKAELDRLPKLVISRKN
jgi:hypothetical protein